MADYISKKRLYLDAEGKVTDDDNKGACWRERNIR